MALRHRLSPAMPLSIIWREWDGLLLPPPPLGRDRGPNATKADRPSTRGRAAALRMRPMGHGDTMTCEQK